jgi:hypothetical protein
MFPLFDLPPELYGMVFDAFVDDAELHEVFLARAASR